MQKLPIANSFPQNCFSEPAESQKQNTKATFDFSAIRHYFNAGSFEQRVIPYKLACD